MLLKSCFKISILRKSSPNLSSFVPTRSFQTNIRYQHSFSQIFKQSSLFSENEETKAVEEAPPAPRVPISVLFKLNHIGAEPDVWQKYIFPSLFTGLVSAGVLYLVNDDDFKEERREGLRDEIYMQRQKMQMEPSPYIEWWIKMHPNEKYIAYLTAANVAIFGVWGISSLMSTPAMTRFMTRWMTHEYHNRRIVTMITSCFSHQTVMHLLFNMVALNSFATLVAHTAGRDQLLAVYLVGGLMGSFGSHLVKAFAKDKAGSLGASGSVFALLAFTAYLYPKNEYSIIFLPFIHAPASTLFPILYGIETLGTLAMIFRVAPFRLDHAAHLGGATFGYLYAKFLKDRHDERMRQQQQQQQQKSMLQRRSY